MLPKVGNMCVHHKFRQCMTSDTQILSGQIIIIIKIKENPNKRSRVRAHLALVYLCVGHGGETADRDLCSAGQEDASGEQVESCDGRQRADGLNTHITTHISSITCATTLSFSRQLLSSPECGGQTEPLWGSQTCS